MFINRFAVLIAAASLIAGPLYAQTKPADSPSAGRKAMADDCAKEHAKHHDHAKERGMEGGMVAKCMDEKKGARKAAKKPLHDHNKIHKSS